jgi:hypothetical protein
MDTINLHWFANQWDLKDPMAALRIGLLSGNAATKRGYGAMRNRSYRFYRSYIPRWLLFESPV